MSVPKDPESDRKLKKIKKKKERSNTNIVHIFF